MEVRERIIEGAAKLFKIYGIRTVTMDSIAADLGISKRTIYETFKDKDALLVAVLQWMTEKQQDLVRRILDSSENAIQAIFRLLESSRDHFQGISPAFHADLKKFHYEALMNRIEKNNLPDYRNIIQVIERGREEKLFRKDINPDIVNRCLYSLGRSVMDYELYPFEEFTRREVVENVFINYLRGISTITGLDLINKLAAKY